MMQGSSNAVDLLITATANPIYTLKLICQRGKLLYLLQLFFPLLFLPLLSGCRLWCLCYGVVFSLFSSYWPQFSLNAQYTLVFLPFLLALTPFGLRRAMEWSSSEAPASLRRSRMLLLCGLVVTASALESWKFGAFFPNQAFRAVDRMPAHFFEPPAAAQGRQDYEDILAVGERIPQAAGLSTQTRLEVYFSNRAIIREFPDTAGADFVLLSLSELRDTDEQALHSLQADKRLTAIAEQGKFTLFSVSR
jgi:hypothetical protein